MASYQRFGLLKEAPPFQQLADELILTDLYAEVAKAEGVAIPSDDMTPFELKLDKVDLRSEEPDPGGEPEMTALTHLDYEAEQSSDNLVSGPVFPTAIGTTTAAPRYAHLLPDSDDQVRPRLIAPVPPPRPSRILAVLASIMWAAVGLGAVVAAWGVASLKVADLPSPADTGR